MKRFVGIAVMAVGAAAVVSISPAAATADTASTIYVDSRDGLCTSGGDGTRANPYCTISAAAAVVEPGQTVLITNGAYAEHVTITRSGTSDQPITFEWVTPSIGGKYVWLTGPTAGLTIDGQHDVAIEGFGVTGDAATDIAISRSSHISLIDAWTSGSFTTPTLVNPVVLDAVSDSTLVDVEAQYFSGAGVLLDAATTGVSVSRSNIHSSAVSGRPVADGIDIFGSHNTITGNQVHGPGGAGITIEAGAADNVIANNRVLGNSGDGIDNRGAVGTAITNNTVEYNCGTGIVVSGDSTDVSVQNNISAHLLTGPACDPVSASSIDVGVYGNATASTTVDYNTVYNADATAPYAWDTPVATLAVFQAASGQAAHDLDVNPADASLPDSDSANSAAPGWQSRDFYGHAPEDDPAAPNSGAGPIGYADRGSIEQTKGPSVSYVLTRSSDGSAVSVNASATTPGWTPTTITSYTFSFGDGTTITQPQPIASHTYSQPGTYGLSVQANDNNGGFGWQNQSLTWTVGTTLTTAASATTVVAGHGVTESAQLTRTDTGQALSGRNLNLQWQKAGTSTWTTVSTRSTDAAGKAAATVTPTGNGAYRWTYAGADGYLPGTSSSRHISVTVTVSIKASAISVTYGTAVKIYTTATPHESGITLQLQRYEGTKGWVTIATASESSTGSATWSIKLPRGSQQLRVVKTATTRYASSHSTTTTIKIS